LALPPDSTFAAGTQELARVTFTSAIFTKPTSTLVRFGDLPTARQLSDAQADALEAFYVNGTVSLAPAAFEADVSPRPQGDSAVGITDWVLVGRYAARLDYPTNSAEFARADCAPQASLGDGAITVSDWVQAGRYAAGMDALTVAGGPISERTLNSAPRRKTELTARRVEVTQVPLVQGQTGTISINLEAQGDENALGLSVAFDPLLLNYVSAGPGKDVAEGVLYVNATQAGSGRLGFVLALPTGKSYAAGMREMISMRFRALTSTPHAQVIALTDVPVPREVCNTSALVLDAAYADGFVTISPLPALRIVQSGQDMVLLWPLWAANFTLQEAAGTGLPFSWSDVETNGHMLTNDNERVLLVPLSTTNKFYRLNLP
jgi:hypothetical protein